MTGATQDWTGRFRRAGAISAWLAAVIGCLMGLNAARAGEAAPPAIVARFHFVEGEKAEQAGNHRKAVEEFEKALAITKTWSSPEARLAYAHALVRVDRKADALREAQNYLADANRSGKDEAEAKARRIILEANPPKPGVPDKIESITLDLGDGVAMKLNKMPAGQFAMGSPPTEPGRSGDERQRPVTLTKPFYMGIYPVAQLQYLAVMGTNPSSFAELGNPVENVSWNDAVEFCRKLSEKTGRKVRLPTEAEWEYACRAGTTTAFNTGDDLKPDQANFDESRKDQTTPVGSYPANALGLFDMHGNVWEWCADRYGDYPEGAATDPQGPERGTYRVLRGGSWYDSAVNCRSAWRDGYDPDSRDDNFGFRAALD